MNQTFLVQQLQQQRRTDLKFNLKKRKKAEEEEEEEGCRIHRSRPIHVKN